MKNNKMPDVVWVGKFYKNEAVAANRNDLLLNACEYHADHIVQRLEREKAELVEVLETIVNGEPTVDDLFDAEKILQKHKDTK